MQFIFNYYIKRGYFVDNIKFWLKFVSNTPYKRFVNSLNCTEVDQNIPLK